MAVPRWLETIALTPPAVRPAELTPEAEDILALLAALEERLQTFKDYLAGTPGLKKIKLREIRNLLKKTDKDFEGMMK